MNISLCETIGYVPKEAWQHLRLFIPLDSYHVPDTWRWMHAASIEVWRAPCTS